MRPEELEAARLLSKNSDLSVYDKEQMIEALWQAQQEEHAASRAAASRSWWKIPSLLVTGFAAAAALVVVISRPAEQADEFAVRSGPMGAAIEVLCDPGPQCTVGSSLALRVLGASPNATYVAAFAVRPDGAVVWYIPYDDAEESAVFGDAEWLSRGVRLGPDHMPGKYTLHAFVSHEPLSVDEVKAFAEAGQGEGIVELTTSFTVTAPSTAPTTDEPASGEPATAGAPDSAASPAEGER